MENFIDNGILLIDKEKDVTSFQTINKLKKKLNIKKIGHSGTLDQNATGLLIAGYGKATKILKYLIKLPKKYVADIHFGIQTNTDDSLGNKINSYKGQIDLDKIKENLKSFIGNIEQLPPDFSAKYVNGERAYKIALKNKKPELKKNKIEIKNINILSFNNPVLRVEIECSSGTYIRSIARDLGIKTQYFAHLSSLNRISIGEFTIEKAKKIDYLNRNNIEIISPFNALYFMPSIKIKKEYISKIKNGMKINENFFEEKKELKNNNYKLHIDNTLLAIVNINNNEIKYDLVF